MGEAALPGLVEAALLQLAEVPCIAPTLLRDSELLFMF